MRAPFSAMEPLTLGVSILMRGEAASASSRVSPVGAPSGCGVCSRLAARRRAAASRFRPKGRAVPARLLLLRLLLLRLLLLSRRLRHEEELPGEQHDHRQHDGEDKIAVVLVHVAFSSRAALSAKREGRKLIGLGLAARFCRRGLVHLGERAFKVLDQLGEGPLYRASPRDQHIIIALRSVGRPREPHRLLEAPACPVADDRATEAFGRGEAEPGEMGVAGDAGARRRA